jgi:hypothetical protein
MSKYLSRLDITGEINLDTPKIVLEEIQLADSIKSIKTIKYNKRNKIKENYENDIDSLRTIAKYVNSKCKNWRKKSLLVAFDFLQKFISDDYIKLFSKSSKRFNIGYGLQTAEEPEKLNACILYRLCKYHSIKTNKDSTYEDMFNKIKLFYYISDNYKIKNKVQNYILNDLKFNWKTYDLVNILNDAEILMPKEVQVHEYEDVKKLGYEEFAKCADKILYEGKEIPENSCEAIILAALNYKIDITECLDPLSEYESLQKETYFPCDEKLKERLKLVSQYPETLESPWLNQVFNPILPENMYSENDLEKLCLEEGIVISDLEDSFDFDYTIKGPKYYNSLQTAYLIESFIHGKQKNIKNSETTFLEKIEDLSFDEVVVYGVRGNIRKDKLPLKGYTYGELLDTFTNYKNFIDPMTKEVFSKEVIEKLYLLSQKEKRETESEENYKDRIELGEEIERIKIYLDNKNEYVEEFVDIYESLIEYDKERVEKLLTGILHLGMYMRGWDGESDYPLKSEETNHNTEKQIVVDDRVTQALIEFEKKTKELGDIGNYIINLPLMEYSKESKSFIPSYDENEGLTVKERIKIVRGGEEGINMNSCIRTSSNKFCATGYYYMVLVGFRLPFNMNEMSHIFKN